MNWLETPQDDAERLLREGLDQAKLRIGDEITHRRVWAKVADVALEVPAPRSGRVALIATGCGLAVAAAIALLSLSYLRDKSSTRPMPAMAKKELPSPYEPKTGVAEATVPVDDLAARTEAKHQPGNHVRTRSGETVRVALGGGAQAELAENSSITWDSQLRPSVEHGTARLSVPHQPPGWRFSVTAGPYVVTVVGTKFDVEVTSRTVGVAVDEGIVEVWRGSRSTRLVAGDTWRGPLHPEESQPLPSKAASAPSERPRVTASRSMVRAFAHTTLLPPNKPAIPRSRGLQEAQDALEAGDTSKALEMLSRMAQGTGPAAENATYELARVTRYNLNRPRQAVALWEKYRARFPAGLLRSEADLSIVETLSQMGEIHAALAEADAFLSRHPNSERRGEVQKLADRLRAAEAESK